MKSGKFAWMETTSRAFKIFKRKVTEAPVLRLPDFSKVFEVTCDVSQVGIDGILSQ